MSRSKFLLAAFVAATAALVAPATSQANFTVKIDVYNANPYPANPIDPTAPVVPVAIATTTVADGGSGFISLDQTLGGVAITLSSLSNAPSGNPGFVAETTAVIRNDTPTTARWVVITVTGDFNPINTGDGSKFNLTSIANTTGNVLTGQGLRNGAGVRTVSSVTGGDPDPVYTDTLTLPNNASADQTTAAVPFERLGGNFLLNNIVVVSLPAGTASKKSQASFSSSAVAAAVAPAPPGIALLMTALPFAGLLRRRLRKSEAVTAA